MIKPAVEAFIEGRNAWKLGVLGFFIRKRGICASIFFTFITMGVPWWFPENFKLNDKIEFTYKYLILTLLCLTSSLFIISIIYLRKRAIRSLNIKYYLHQLTHDIRDKQNEFYKTLSKKQSYTKSKLHKDTTLLLNEIANNIAKHFKLLTGDDTICVAIRIARYEKNDKKIYYRTYARSKGLNPQRKKFSEDIPQNKGLPNHLKNDNECQGILIYNNLQKAATKGHFYLTKNDNKFPDDIKTMMVSPLNAWSGSSESMIGILYVTSRYKNIFKPIHVDSMAFVSDLTASTVANLFAIVKEKTNNQHLKKGSEYAKIT